MTAPTQAAGRFTYWAVAAAVDHNITIGPADSVRDGWWDADCLCDWHTSGTQTVVDDAAHEHVAADHKQQVEAETVYLTAARAYRETTGAYNQTVYDSTGDRERRLQADTAMLAGEEPFRAAIDAARAARHPKTCGPDLRHLAYILDAGREAAESFQNPALSTVLAWMTEATVTAYDPDVTGGFDVETVFAAIAARYR